MRLLAPLFFWTGAFALAYEVVWARYLALFLGHDAYAHAVVLASFMGGQALGYVLGGRAAERVGRRIALYGAVEVAIGAFAAAFPALYGRASAAFIEAATGLAPDGAALLGLKLAAAAALILPPAVLMGTTLPLLAAGATAAGELPGRALGRLYAANCAGAVLGTLASGYALVPELGLAASMHGVGAMNVGVGVAAVVLQAFTTTTRKGENENEPEPASGPAPLRRALLLGSFLTGSAALLYEVAWTRLLALTLGGSTYAFTIMLAAFIGGIALGARISSRPRLAGHPSPARLFAAVELALAFAVALTIGLAEYLPYAYNVLRGALPLTDAGFWGLQAAQLLLSLAVLIVPTTLGGLALPLAARALAPPESAPGAVSRGIAASFAANTAGSLAGALAAGFLLLPQLGLRHTFTVGVALNAAAGAAVLLAAAPAGAPALRRIFPPAALALAAVILALLPSIERSAFTLQIFRGHAREQPGGLAEYRRQLGERAKRIVYDRDGAGATVTVLRGKTTGTLTMLINGKPDASTGGDVRTQLLLAHIPLLLKPDARKALCIGLGSGMTAGSILKHPIERLDVFELSPEVVEASRLFDAETGAPLADPRTRLTVADARTALALSTERWDVVTSEPSNPWVAGIGSLFTREHLEAVAAKLAPGGICLQWIHTYEISDELVYLVLRTFLAVFPEVRVFTERGQRDLFLVGANAPLDIDLDALAARFALPAVRRDLARDRLLVPEALLALELYGPEEAPELLTPGGPLNTDDRPLLEFGAPRPFFLGQSARRIPSFATAPGRPQPRDRVLDRWLARKPFDDETHAAVRKYLDQKPRMPWRLPGDPD